MTQAMTQAMEQGRGPLHLLPALARPPQPVHWAPAASVQAPAAQLLRLAPAGTAGLGETAADQALQAVHLSTACRH